MNDMIDFSKGDAGSDSDDAVRRESWPVQGPAELELSVDVGTIAVHLDSADVEAVTVELRHDASAVTGWMQGVSGLISWLGNASGDRDGPDPARLAADAVQGAEISWSEPARRLVVRSAQELPLRVVPLMVTVTAPAGSRVAARTGAGDVTVTGRAGWAAVRTGSGGATLGPVDGDADVTTGTGDITLGVVSGRSRVRTGSGAIALAGTGGTSDIKAGSGDVELGTVAGDLQVRTGSGDLRISDARTGTYDLTTGSGELRVGVHPGTRARVDLSSGSGTARSDLDVNTSAPEQGATVEVRGRTGSGDVLVTRAVVPA